MRDLKRGEAGIVIGFLESVAVLEEELREIGFAEGDEVEVLEFGAVNRSPVSVRLNRTIIAVRGHEAAAIELRRV